MGLEVITFTAPAYWSSYYINGDASGLESGERKRADEYLAAQIPEGATNGSVVDCEDEARFTWSFDLYGGECSGGEVLDYTLLYAPAKEATA